MHARRAAPGPLPGFAILHLIVLAGALLGLTEGVYHLFGPRPPAGHPGADGPSLVAYTALGMAAFLLPALAGALGSTRLPATPSAIVVWLAALLPTAFAYLDHVVHRRQVSGFLVEVGGLPHLVRVGGVALLLASLCTAVGVWLSWRWWDRLARSGQGLQAAASSLLWPPLCLLLLGVMLPPGRPEEKAGADPDLPNVLLLSIDTLRQDAVGAYGGAATPHLDDLIGSGVRADGWSCASWTRPAMAALFSGVSTTGNGANDDRAVCAEVEWWPQRLAEAGYLTQAVVTNPHLTRRYHFDRGFGGFEHSGELERLEPIALSVWAHWITRQLTDRRRLNRGDRVVDRAIAWLERASSARAPWFLWVHLIDPHLPYDLRGENGELKAAEDPPWLHHLEGDLVEGRFIDLEGAREGRRVASKEARDALRQLYLREVRFTDAQVGRLIEAVRAASGPRGLVWILASDHGEEFFEHGSFEHGHSLHSEVLRVPLAMGGEGLPRGGVIAGMKLQDVGPSLLGHLELAPFGPARGSGLAESDTLLARLALGEDISARLRSAEALGEVCAPPAMVVEGMLYGSPQTRLVSEDGPSVLRDDDAGQFVAMNVCRDAAEVDVRTLDTCPPELEEVLRTLDAWRERTAERGETVQVDSQLRRSLEALGYVD